MSANGKTDELTPRQLDFLRLYNDPKSKTFSNALQSALKAGYSQEYAETITSQFPDWLSDNLGRRKRLLEKAEQNLEDLLDDKTDIKVRADITKFVAKTIGKENYSERTEMTGKNGKDLIPDQESRKKADSVINDYLNGDKGNTKRK